MTLCQHWSYSTKASAAATGVELSEIIIHRLYTLSTELLMTLCQHRSYGTKASAAATGVELSQIIIHRLYTLNTEPPLLTVSTLIIWDSPVPGMTADTLEPCGTQASAALVKAKLFISDHTLSSSWWHYMLTLIIWDSPLSGMTADTPGALWHQEQCSHNVCQNQ